MSPNITNKHRLSNGQRNLQATGILTTTNKRDLRRLPRSNSSSLGVFRPWSCKKATSMLLLISEIRLTTWDVQNTVKGAGCWQKNSMTEEAYISFHILRNPGNTTCANFVLGLTNPPWRVKRSTFTWLLWWDFIRNQVETCHVYILCDLFQDQPSPMMRHSGW